MCVTLLFDRILALFFDFDKKFIPKIYATNEYW